MSRKNLLIGITGSIAAKKTSTLIDLLKDYFNIKIIITYEGSNYIDKEYFSKLDTYYSWDKNREESTHIKLSRWADDFIIYPATSNIISLISNGSGEDLLTTTILMYNGRLKIFPAMHEEMANNPYHIKNLERLLEHHDIYGPEYGKLDVGDEGLGRLIDPNIAFKLITDIKNTKVFIISGPTKEYIDDVRYISNDSSGKQGYALAVEAAARGFNTTYISSMPPNQNTGFHYINFNNTESLLRVIENTDLSDGYLFMPAAISDFITKKIDGKINRRDGEFVVNLSPNVDILSLIASKNPKLTTIGFSAQLNMDEDMTKIVEKGLDFLVINDISKKETGFGSDFNEIAILDKDGNIQRIEKLNKFVIAKEIMNYVIK